MEVSITHFRRNIVDIFDLAESGAEVWVTCKERRFQVVPEAKRVSRFSRITPMEIINPNSSEEDELEMKRAMQREWEKDWEDL